MRIAYIAPYQGPDLLERRPIIHNRSIASDIKIGLAARLLHERSNSVEIISQGEVVRSGMRFYPGFVESQQFHPEIPVFYSSALTVRFITGFWEEMQALRLFKMRHKVEPFDAIILYNTKRAQLACANYAIDALHLPVLLDYEDDAFTTFTGESLGGFTSSYHRRAAQRVLNRLSGCFAVSPHLLSHVPASVPKLLVRGIVDPAIVKTSQSGQAPKKNWVSFAGTHSKTNGVASLIKAWLALNLPGWELHLAGEGEETPLLKTMAADRNDIAFHGVVRGQSLADFLCSSKICVSPTEVSRTPGNVFPCKIIDYLAAGAHVIATPAGPLEKEIEAGMTYVSSNDPETLAGAIQKVIRERRWEQNIATLIQERYGAAAVGAALEDLLQKARAADAQNSRVAHRLAAGVS